jgi:hypothetical protein
MLLHAPHFVAGELSHRNASATAHLRFCRKFVQGVVDHQFAISVG